jgi:hypothetical protein
MLNDKQPFIANKKARIARSGTQVYTAQEFASMGITLKDGKEFGSIYRPPEVLIKNKEKFARVSFVNDHTPVNVTPDNWKEYTVGFIGSKIDIDIVDNDVWITGEAIFYDRTAYDAYEKGKVELSAGYDPVLSVVNDPDKVGYDYILKDIVAVNHVALCDKARAGSNARILDSVAQNNNEKNSTKELGGIEMSRIRNGFLRALGIGKAKDENFKFSKILMDSVAKVPTLDEENLKKEISSVMEHVTTLGDSDARALLAGTVADCFKHSVEVITKKDEVSKKIDELYTKCLDADAEIVASILDKKEEEKKEEKEEGKEGEEKKDEPSSAKDSIDIEKVVEAAISKAVTTLNDSIKTQVDDAVKKALGLGEEKDKKDQGGLEDSYGKNEDASFLTRGIFGSM